MEAGEGNPPAVVERGRIRVRDGLRGQIRIMPRYRSTPLAYIRQWRILLRYAVHCEARVDRPSFLSFNRFRECRVEIAYGLAIELRALRDSHR
jgi:hypothetical protein